MKKNYIQPQIEEVQLKASYQLLAGSVQDQGQGVLGVSIFDSSSSQDEITENDTY
jgi:hypothetical protein